MKKLRLIDIKEAIEEEKSLVSEHYYFVVKKNINKTNNICEILVDTSKKNNGKLDESLEGAKIWWINDKKDQKTKGQAEVLSVLPSQEKICLRFIVGELPKKETIINIYPKIFIESLENAWSNQESSNKAICWLDEVENAENDIEKIKVDKKLFSSKHSWLRKNQKKAFNLLKVKGGLLWGPPGTGKTTTVGVIMANYLKNNPSSKVLLLSTTNLAVDQVLSSINRELITLDPTKNLAKKMLVRVGSRFNPSSYKGVEYLLGGNEEIHIKKLIEHESIMPDKSDAENYFQWKLELEKLQNNSKKDFQSTIESKNLNAMTTIRALYGFDTLKDKKYDIIIFDEASQIPLAQSIMLAPLGKHVIFTGDPYQLSPVCISSNKNTQNILGNSIFKYKDSIFKNMTCFLDEQSRMKNEICKIVSNVFYDGLLKSAKIIPNIEVWEKERYIGKTNSLNNDIIIKITVNEEVNWSQIYGGYIRYDSALRIVKICKELLEKHSANQIKILTPFKSQKNLIKKLLKDNGIKEIKVDTVHKSQGSEYHTVIFDPVDGSNDFIKERKNLINVAMSRAKARLIIAMSEKDKKNTVLKITSNLMENSNESNNNSIKKYFKGNFLDDSVIGNNINYGDVEGKVLEINRNKNTFILACFKTGKEKKIGIQWIYDKWVKK